MQKLLPPRLYFIALTLIVVGNFIFGKPASTSLALLIVGVLVAVAGLSITIYHAVLFRTENTNIYTFNSPGKLVKKALFQYSRNPMYLGFSLSLLGWTLAFSSWLGLLALLAFIVAADRWYIPFEERLMLEKFGQEYQRYCEQTARWFTVKLRHPES